jgi:hypothetical protein
MGGGLWYGHRQGERRVAGDPSKLGANERREEEQPEQTDAGVVEAGDLPIETRKGFWGTPQPPPGFLELRILKGLHRAFWGSAEDKALTAGEFAAENWWLRGPLEENKRVRKWDNRLRGPLVGSLVVGTAAKFEVVDHKSESWSTPQSRVFAKRARKLLKTKDGDCF